MATTMLLVAVTLILAFRDGYCCMCEPRHPQQHFCGSDFVVQAGVLDKDLVYDNDYHIANHFIVNVKKVYKASEAYENVTQFFISSPAITHNQCGIADLVIGQDYLITGFIANGELQTTTCDWVKPHSELTAAQKNGLSSKYELGCQKCNIAACRDGQCGGNSQPAGSTCVWDFFDRLADCYIQHGICRHNGNECSWASTNVFQECEENILFGGSLTHDGPTIW